MFKFLLTLIFLQTAYAGKNIYNSNIYRKCYKQFTNKRVLNTSKIIKDIESKKISSAKACLNLINKASLNNSLILREQTQESITVLKNIQLLHNSWFKLYNLNRETQDHGVTNTIDSNQMAYQYTAALLNDSIEYSSVFTTRETLWAKRKGNHLNNFSNDKDIQGRRSKIDGSGLRKWQVGGIEDNPDDYGDVLYFRPLLVEFGELIGLKKVENHLYFKRLVRGQTQDKTTLTKNIFPGVFGSTPYLLLNLGHNNQYTNGGEKLHRRFANNLFSDFLCRDLPVLLPQDIKVIKSSKLAFRNQKSCMGCHQTMDQLASMTSNLEPFNAGEVHTNAYTFRAVYQHRKIKSAKYSFVDNDKDYYKKSHQSKLYFRDYKGQLIDLVISTPDMLGSTLKELDDPYLCTVNRYFNYLTGVNVDLNNFNKIPNSNPIKKFLLVLMKDLKTNQRPINIFEKVFNSPYYLTKKEMSSYE